MAEKSPPKINIRFLYSYCNDILAVRKFYSECLGMLEAGWHNDDKFGWLNYRSEGLEYMFFRVKEPLPVAQPGFAAQPGGGGGELLIPSWSIEVPEAQYPEVVARLQQAGYASNQKNPVWLQNSYWGYVVKDPAGNTVEVFSSPKSKPSSNVWGS